MVVSQVCSKNLHIPKSKFEVLLFLKEEEEEKKSPLCFIHMKKAFRNLKNTACKEKRGECVIFNGKNSCLGQIETRWERKNQKSEAETHSGKRHQRRNVLSRQRGGSSLTFFLWRWTMFPCPGTWKRNRRECTKRSKERVPETNQSRPTGLGVFIRVAQSLACSGGDGLKPQNKRLSLCPHSTPRVEK